MKKYMLLVSGMDDGSFTPEYICDTDFFETKEEVQEAFKKALDKSLGEEVLKVIKVDEGYTEEYQDILRKGSYDPNLYELAEEAWERTERGFSPYLIEIREIPA